MMHDKPQLSIVIRTLNEEKWLPSVLKSLREQTVKDIEIILVDSGSTDRTLEIAKKFDCKIIKIKKEEFTYPYALNIGFKEASADLIGVISGHSVPISNRWAERGLSHFEDPQVAAMSGPIQALPDANWIERLWYLPQFLMWKVFPRFIKIHKTLDNRNSMIRKSYWEKYNFDETLVNGSEDYDWALHAARICSKKILYDSKFQAKHSHSGIGKPTDIKLMLTTWRKENKMIDKRY